MEARIFFEINFGTQIQNEELSLFSVATSNSKRAGIIPSHHGTKLKQDIFIAYCAYHGGGQQVSLIHQHLVITSSKCQLCR